MVKLIVLYREPEDRAAFDKYYFGTHLPLVKEIPGVIRWEVSRFTGVAGEGENPFYLVAVVYFKSKEELDAAFETTPGRALNKDRKNFTTPGQVMIMYAEDAEEVS